MNSNIAIIDLEASGLHVDSYPIEVGVLLDGKSYSWLIRPEPNWVYWSETAESLHGISREMLLRDGLPALEVVGKLEACLIGFDSTLYSDAQPWDAGWIDTLYCAANRKRPFLVGSIFDLLSEAGKHNFCVHKLDLADSGKYQHHRAGSDVKMLAEAFRLATNHHLTTGPHQ